MKNASSVLCTTPSVSCKTDPLCIVCYIEKRKCYHYPLRCENALKVTCTKCKKVGHMAILHKGHPRNKEVVAKARRNLRSLAFFYYQLKNDRQRKMREERENQEKKPDPTESP